MKDLRIQWSRVFKLVYEATLILFSMDTRVESCISLLILKLIGHGGHIVVM